MVGRVHSPKKHFQFILTIKPKEELTSEQGLFLFESDIEKIRGTNIYTRKGSNFLTMFLCLDSLENENPFLGLRDMEYTLIKKEMKKDD